MIHWIKELVRDLHLPHPPFWLLAAAIVFTVLTWVPLAIVARGRVTLSHQPPVHLFQDMGEQPKWKPQTWSTIYEDHRAMRQPVAHTVARDQLHADDHMYRGYTLQKGADGKPKPIYSQGMPSQIKVNEHLMKRGQQEFMIYCFPCHGEDGRGKGPVDVRAARLAKTGVEGTAWIPPSNMVGTNNDGSLTYGPKNYPDGELFNTITHGRRNMPPYGPQIAVKDRWAIIAYVRSLQLAQHENKPQSEKSDARPQPQQQQKQQQ